MEATKIFTDRLRYKKNIIHIYNKASQWGYFFNKYCWEIGYSGPINEIETLSYIIEDNIQELT